MAEKHAKALTCKAAYDLVKKDPRAVIVDIRSTMEFLFVGHPTGAIHVPWIDEPEWTINPHFITDVRKILLGGATSHDDIGGAPVILICRSGKRSIDAGKALLDAGFSEVFYVDEGFEGELDELRHRGSIGGWRFHGMPWEQC
ncbi:MAG TPA: rhodanese-like domain-containing protein [Gammaproteobacteria bacterium]|jgi:rhodanese-related sulfurtransferase